MGLLGRMGRWFNELLEMVDGMRGFQDFIRIFLLMAPLDQPE